MVRKIDLRWGRGTEEGGCNSYILALNEATDQYHHKHIANSNKSSVKSIPVSHLS